MSTVPPPPPGLVPTPYPAPGSQLEPPQPPASPEPPMPAGFTKSRGITISPRCVSWVPVACLTLIAILTFFPWVGSFIGSSAVYSQNAWRLISGDPSRNFRLEKLLPSQGAWMEKHPVNSDWYLMVPYILCLILGLILAWAERAVATVDPYNLPPQLRWIGTIWPYRNPIIAGLAALALGLLLIQMMSGFGLERAMKAAITAQFAEERKKPENASPAAQDEIGYREDQELSKYNLERTNWLYLTVLLHVVAVLAITARAALDTRGNKPPPRLVLQY